VAFAIVFPATLFHLSSIHTFIDKNAEKLNKNIIAYLAKMVPKNFVRNHISAVGLADTAELLNDMADEFKVRKY